ncbi:tRNA (guanosine(37)-N1)-methyltransferase TrmD [Patescibacteria group bacterium]|nr:tRNA (guanosine(37)-N1)-methyltransferase TrmD [Patescibacteria group bacterium]
MIKFDIITLFPHLFTEHFANLPFKKAIEKNLAEYKLWDLKNFSTNNYGSVDDKTYGGGVGMILMIEPVYKALEEIYGKNIMKKQIQDEKNNSLDKGSKIIVLSPRGSNFNQNKAMELSKYSQITLICGRYEGIDARVEESIATDVISIGDFVLSGGEIPALAIMESMTRLIPGVLEKKEASEIESFSKISDMGKSQYIEYPQYTRPENFMGLKVPDVLLSGNHKEIERWRIDNSEKLSV